MAALVQPLTTYSDTTPQKRVVTDVISNIDPVDTPLLSNIGGLDGASGKFRFVNGKSTRVEWLEDTLPALGNSLTATVSSAATVLTVSDGYAFHTGDIVMIDNEYVWVSAINSATTVTVVRGFGSTAATHSTNANVSIVSNARLENATNDYRGATDITSNYNYTQIFHEGVSVSRTQRQISQYGIDDELDYQADKAIPHMTRLIEKSLFYNPRNAGSASSPRTFGGLPVFITINTVALSGNITQANIENALKAAYLSGGTGPWIMALDTTQMQAVKNIYENNQYLKVERNENVLGMVITAAETPFGRVDFVLDRWARPDRFFVIDPKHVGMYTFYPFTLEPMASNADGDNAQVVGEFTLCVRQDKAHAYIGS